MTTKDKNVAKSIRSAVQLEQELQIAFAQKCVAVLDIYSAEWGHCRAISETFTRLKTEAGDDLRFFMVDCNSVLDSLKQPEDAQQRRTQRPKNIDAMRDTLPEVWQPVLEDRRGKAEPYFLFYKEGKKTNAVQGVNTPLIRTLVKDLCTVKTPASEFITNTKLQEIWDEYFNPEESEVPVDKFLKALTAMCKLTVTLNDEEKSTLLEAMSVAKGDGKTRIVHAEGLQKWFGDDESRTMQQAFNDTLPDYEERATQVRLEREAEEKRRQEEEEKRKADEEKAALERKAEEDREEEERKKEEPPQKSAAERFRELDAEVTDLEGALEAPVLEESCWTEEGFGDKLEATGAAVTADVSEREGRVPQSQAKAESADDANAAAAATLAALKEFSETSFANALGGEAPMFAAKARDSIHTATSSVDKLGIAKLAGAMLTYSQDECTVAFGEGKGKDFVTLVQEANFRDNEYVSSVAHPFLVATTSLASEAPADMYVLLPTDSAAADSTITFDPLTPFYPDTAPEAPEGTTAIKVTGVKSVIDQRPFSKFPKDAFCYGAWYNAGKVVAVEGGVEIALDEAAPAEDDFTNLCATFASKVREDDELCRKILSLYTKRQEREVARAEMEKEEAEKPKEEEKPAEEAPAEEKPASPTEKAASPTEEKPAEEKPASPTEEKAATPTEEKPASPTEEKAASPTEEKPASPTEEKAATPTEEKAASPTEEKPAEEKPAEEAPAAEEKPASPTEEKAATPTEEKPASPTEEKAATPTEEKPASPTEEKAASPTEEKPASPTEEKPAEEKPASPTEEKAASPTEEKPAEEKPAEDKPAWMDE